MKSLLFWLVLCSLGFCAYVSTGLNTDKILFNTYVEVGQKLGDVTVYTQQIGNKESIKDSYNVIGFRYYKEL